MLNQNLVYIFRNGETTISHFVFAQNLSLYETTAHYITCAHETMWIKYA